MKFIYKLGLSILAGAAVLFGINCAEKYNNSTESTNDNNTNNSSIDDSGVTMTSSPEEEIQKEQKSQKKKPGGFMSNAKKVHNTVETISRIITCIYRIIHSINDMFSPSRSYYNGYYSNYGQQGGTTIII
jgi:hypothetical protein